MNKAELEKEAIRCMHEIKYWLRVPIKKETEKDGISEILKLTEPREKRIADLEAENEQIKNSDTLCKLIGEQKRKITELEAQIEKLIDFVLSKTECCDVCPITDTCINREGTCPYAGILAKGEEEVTREWLMQKIVKEIKEK